MSFVSYAEGNARLSINNQHYALNYITALFNIQAPTCFGNSLPSSGSSLDPCELLEMQCIVLVVYATSQCIMLDVYATSQCIVLDVYATSQCIVLVVYATSQCIVLGVYATTSNEQYEH
jgi:hypothetical protein